MGNVEVEREGNHSLMLPQDPPGLDLWEERSLVIAEFVNHPVKSLPGLFFLVRSCSTEEQQQIIVGETLNTLLDSLDNGEITPKQFDMRLLKVLEVDQTKNTQGERACRLVREVISGMMFSEEDEEAERAKRLCAAISVSAMERYLERIDIHVCSAKRMAAYIRNVAFQIFRADRGDIPEWKKSSYSELLTVLLGVALERDEDIDDRGFADEVMAALLCRDSSEDLINTLKECGGDAGAIFLKNNWQYGNA